MEGSRSFLTADDFQNVGRSINLGIFTNLEKGITPEEFHLHYSNHRIFTRESVQKIADEVRKKSENIEKSEDGESREDILKQGADFINSLEEVRVKTADGVSTFFVKAQDSDDAEETDELEKGVLSDALEYGTMGTNKFKKTGKDIKDKISEIESKIREQLLLKETEKTTLATTVGYLPTLPLDRWERRDLSEELSNSILKYPWSCCYYEKTASSNDGVYLPSDSATATNKVVNTEVSANAARDYNACQEAVISMYQDLDKIATLSRNLEDKTTYDLSFKELNALGF